MHDLPSPSQRFVIRRVRGHGRALPDELSQFGGPDWLPLYAEVDAETDAWTFARVAEGLRGSALRSTDLVFEHDRWCTLRESVTFGELAVSSARREALVRFAIGFAMLVTSFALYALKAWIGAGR